MAAPSGQLVEREIKLEAPEGFELPELEGRRLRSKRLIAAYYDTADLRLARTGITLRYRREGRARGRWQLKLPHADGRLEVAFAGDADAPPGEVTALLVAAVRDAPLERVCAMETRRSGVRVARDGEPLADVLVDEVTADVENAARLHFRELEVEAIDGASDADLRRIAKTLRRAGAVRSDERPKLFRALGFEPARLESAPQDDSPREHIRLRIERQRRAMLASDPGTR